MGYFYEVVSILWQLLVILVKGVTYIWWEIVDIGQWLIYGEQPNTTENPTQQEVFQQPSQNLRAPKEQALSYGRQNQQTTEEQSLTHRKSTIYPRPEAIVQNEPRHVVTRDADTQGTHLDQSNEENALTLNNLYKIVRAKSYKLGRGGFGKVWLGTNIQTGQWVAVKEVDNTDDLKHFVERELLYMYRCNHPNVVKLLAHVQQPDKVYLIMDYYRLGNLSSYANSLGYKIRFAMCGRFMNEMSAAVEYLHGQKICHRDIKPQNVLVCEQETNGSTLKLTDMGLASGTDGFSSKSASAGRGTVGWMAPEIATGRSRYRGHAVDIFSLGLLFLALLMHRPGESLPPPEVSNSLYSSWISVHANGEIPDFDEESDDMKMRLAKAIIRNMISYDPSERCSAKEVCERVKKLLTGTLCVRATQDFTSTDAEHLSFQQGDIMDVISETTDSGILAKHPQTNVQGKVRSSCVVEETALECMKWYIGEMNRQDCTELLLSQVTTGSFCVSFDQSSGSYVLSVWDHSDHEDEKDYVKHYPINMSGTGEFSITHQSSHRSIFSLIHHYRGHDDGLCCKLKKSCSKKKPSLSDLVKDLHKYSIPSKELQVKDNLHDGQFGGLSQGKLRERGKVVVKIVNRNEMTQVQQQLLVFLRNQCHHNNLQKMYGVCVQDDDILMVFEHNCDLLSYLKSSKGQDLTQDELFGIAGQIARGMAFLEKKKCVHRRLMACAVLVGEHKKVKIEVVSITHPDQPTRQTNLLPTRWCAPEVLTDQTVSIKSNIWAFGIVVVEIYSHGDTPYPDMRDDSTVSREVKSGNKHPKPRHMPEKVWKTILKCLESEPVNRPTFSRLDTLFSRSISVRKISHITLPVRSGASLTFGSEDFIVGFEDHPEFYFYEFKSNTFQLTWHKTIPEGLNENTRKQISPNKDIYIHHSDNEIWVFNKELNLIRKLPSPGSMIGLIAGGHYGVFDNSELPSSKTTDIRRVSLHPLTNLQASHRQLDVPKQGPYSREDTLYACGPEEDKVAVVSISEPYLDIYGSEGCHVCRAPLPLVPEELNCSSTKVLVPLWKEPRILVFSWSGQLLQTLGPPQLGLDTHGLITVSSVCDGRFSLHVAPPRLAFEVHTYEITELEDEDE